MLLNNLPGKWQLPISPVLHISILPVGGGPCQADSAQDRGGLTGKDPQSLPWSLCPGHAPVSVPSLRDPVLQHQLETQMGYYTYRHLR